MNNETKVKTLFNKINKSKSFKSVNALIRPVDGRLAFIEFTYHYRNNNIMGAIEWVKTSVNLRIGGYSHTLKKTYSEIVININELGPTQDLNKLKKILNQHWGLY